MEQLRQELEAVRIRLVDSGAGVVEPVGLAVDADAETMAGQEVPTPLAARPPRTTSTGGARCRVSPVARPRLARQVPRVGSARALRLAQGRFDQASAGGGRVSGGSQRPADGRFPFLLAADTIHRLDRPPGPAVGTASPAPQPPPSPAVSAAEQRAPSAVEGPRAHGPQIVTLRATARRQLTAGRPQEALDTISAGLVLDASDTELRALVADLARAARQSVTASRAAAAKIGVTEAASAEVRDARGREREADALERSGNPVAAIRAWWMAAALYDRTAKAATRSVPREPAAPAATAPQAGVTSPPQPSRAQSPAVVPLAPGMLPPTTDLPLPGPPPPTATAKPAAPAVDPRSADLAAIRDLLRHYVEAYAARDVNAVAKVMPSLSQPQLRALERDFSNFRSYRVEIADERIAVDGSTATVACRVGRSFVSRTGTDGGNTVTSVFHLRKVGGAWVIESLQSR